MNFLWQWWAEFNSLGRLCAFQPFMDRFETRSCQGYRGSSASLDGIGFFRDYHRPNISFYALRVILAVDSSPGQETVKKIIQVGVDVNT